MNDIERAVNTIKEILDCEDAIEVAFPALTNALTTSLKALEKQLNSGWIPVSESLPEPEKNVLILQSYEDSTNITIGHLHQDRDFRRKPYWNWIKYGSDMVHPKIESYHRAEFICPGSEYVTHWQPLPENEWTLEGIYRELQ